MTPNGPEAALEAMEEILELERSLLEAGRAREAADLSQQKLEALGMLQTLAESGALKGASSQVRAQAARISGLAHENAALLEAVRNGINSLLTRITQAGGSAYVGSYGHRGAQLTFSQAAGSYHRRV